MKSKLFAMDRYQIANTKSVIGGQLITWHVTIGSDTYISGTGADQNTNFDKDVKTDKK